MKSAPDFLAWHLRFGLQLKALGELTESLTLRLLEMEERLLQMEDKHFLLLDRPGLNSVDSAAVLDLLGHTDDRLTRLETLLALSAHSQVPGGMAPAGGLVRTLRVLTDDDPARVQEYEGELLFPEDEEQPFMNEETA
ncbi:MAG: hypothetical protein NTW83_01195 [Cyanobacteria bacterium]|jgi:ABC-type transporter Mla MlaB component|nr:hypothetical protein [Cyanobacteriota bacterium]